MKSSLPDPSPTDKFYQGAAGRDYHDFKRGLPAKALPWVTALRERKFRTHVRLEDVVIELGVGSGWNLAGLRCARRIGCDAAQFLAERLAGSGIEFVNDIRAVPDATAHVAICHHTLEHLLDPAEALRQLGRVLKPGGKLIVHVPWERERRYQQFRADEPNHHLFTWNAQDLGNLVATLGFSVQSVAVCRYGYDRFAANLAVRWRIGEVGFRLLRAALIALKPNLEVELVALC